MKTKKLTPRNVAPVKRNSVATASTKAAGDISPLFGPGFPVFSPVPFAGDDAE